MTLRIHLFVMGQAEPQHLLSVAEYFAAEERGEIRHEYIGGRLYAMAGSTAAHNTIILNVAGALRQRLRSGGPCKVFVNDIKVRLRIAGEDLFYYPDIVVTCHPIGAKDHFTRFPTVIFEVLSDSTELTDRREKLTNYRQCDTLEEYILVDQYRREVTQHRRNDGWASLLITADDAAVELPSLNTSIALAEIYDGMELLPFAVEEARAAQGATPASRPVI
ncbi:MAG: Uma2 family endonuclease [Opitutaceae bacterium]